MISADITYVQRRADRLAEHLVGLYDQLRMEHAHYAGLERERQLIAYMPGLDSYTQVQRLRTLDHRMSLSEKAASGTLLAIDNVCAELEGL